MSFNPLSITSQPYIGSPYRLPAGYRPAADDSPAIVPTVIDWINYGVSLLNPNAGVFVSLKGGGAGANRASLISIIRGVYIDNTGSDGSIYVYFADTQYMVTCPPYSTAWCPVLTAGVEFTVYGKNFTTGDLSQTKVYAVNFPVMPSLDSELQINYPQWKSSPQLEKGLNLYSNGFASPSLGDQFQFQTVALNGLNGTIQTKLFGTPYLQSGWIILTDITLDFFNSTGVFDGNTAFTSQIQSTGLGGTFHFAEYFDSASTTKPGILFQKTGLQLRLNAAENWLWKVGPVGALGVTGSNINLHVGYCYQGMPNAQQSIKTFGILGNVTTSKQNLNASGAPAPKYVALKFVMPANGLITGFAITTNNTAQLATSGIYQGFLYADAGAQPSYLIGYTPETSFTVFNNTIVPNQPLAFSNYVAATGGTHYWLILQCVEDGSYPVCGFALSNAVAGYTSYTGNTLSGFAVIGGGLEFQANITYQPV